MTIPLVRFLAAVLSFTTVVVAHEKEAAAATSPTTCIVSGDKLGEMGSPVKYTYKQAGQPDRELQFCCKDCIADFEKDPAKYLAKLDERSKSPANDCCTTGGGSCCHAGAACCASADGQKKTTTSTGASSDAACCSTGEQGCELLDAYLPVAKALAADDLANARSTASALQKIASSDGVTAIATSAAAIASAADLTAARASFKALSREVVPLADGAPGVVVMTCPMAKADWVQSGAGVQNPYYGKAMLTCGMPKKG